MFSSPISKLPAGIKTISAPSFFQLTRFFTCFSIRSSETGSHPTKQHSTNKVNSLIPREILFLIFMFPNLYLDLAYKYSGELDREDNLISDGGQGRAMSEEYFSH